MSYLRLNCQALHSAAVAYHSDYNEQMSVCDLVKMYVPPRSVMTIGFFGFKANSACDSPLENSDFKPTQGLKQKYCPKCGRTQTGYQYALLLKADEAEHLCVMNVYDKLDGKK